MAADYTDPIEILPGQTRPILNTCDDNRIFPSWCQKNIDNALGKVANRSLMILKMLAFEPTGAIVAASTFSLREDPATAIP